MLFSTSYTPNFLFFFLILLPFFLSIFARDFQVRGTPKRESVRFARPYGLNEPPFSNTRHGNQTIYFTSQYKKILHH